MNNKRIELLAPAGDLEKLKVALIYGADAVFIGGREFSLRSKASNFTLDEIRQGCEFAHRLNKKVHVTCNIVMHNNDVSDIKKYLIALDNIGVDAIITSSLYMVKLAKKYTNLQVHISTQQSSLNKEAIDFFASLGADRVVLGREASLKDMKDICENKPCEIEAFIHGGMCSSYSGKCMLSNVMCNRDANRGGCAYSCRWFYNVYNGEKLITKDNEFLKMSSKDLCAINEIPQLIEMGVDSLKIEGRRKASNYIACVVKAYREVIDAYYNNQPIDFIKARDDIYKAENRLTSTGFLYGNVTREQMLYNLDERLIKIGDYVALVIDSDEEYATIEIHNKLELGKDYLLHSPKEDDRMIHISEILDNKGKEMEVATIGKQLVKIKVDRKFEPYSIIRLIRSK
ncbi:MAG: U32 family peptidase [Bacillales bacterium]|nr:U32 family peptidase [Bacillales bacterium]